MRFPVNSPFRISTPYGKVAGYPLNNGFHMGLDLVSNDKKLVAPQSGKIIRVGYGKLEGNYIILENKPNEHYLGHIKTGSIRVKVGQTVKEGQWIATMGRTGYADGVHVHWELRVFGTRVDPAKHITGEEMLTKSEVELTYMLAFDVNQASVNKNVVTAFTGKPIRELLQFLQADPSYKAHKVKMGRPTNFVEVKEQLYKKG